MSTHNPLFWPQGSFTVIPGTITSSSALEGIKTGDVVKLNGIRFRVKRKDNLHTLTTKKLGWFANAWRDIWDWLKKVFNV